ncbi:hypothetical protein BJ742DRAFT_740475 [Cladochytrium replicatum]|nr:hypothetical protein BJ742DRAFT_740475 [Cladochytrium replicatum]
MGRMPQRRIKLLEDGNTFATVVLSAVDSIRDHGVEFPDLLYLNNALVEFEKMWSSNFSNHVFMNVPRFVVTYAKWRWRSFPNLSAKQQWGHVCACFEKLGVNNVQEDEEGQDEDGNGDGNEDGSSTISRMSVIQVKERTPLAEGRSK